IFMIIQWYAKLGLQFTNVGFAMSLILLFIVHEREKTTIIINQQKKIIEQQKGLIEKENELSDMKITLFESQIKPHFVFNVLNTIYMLCDMDVEKAKTAISEFSEYFRSNAELIETRGTIPFLRELEHVQGYLSLEKIRFGDKIEVLYDLKENGFEIPPYTLQSIVENAVKHGVGKKKEGGRLIIRTGKNDDEYFIIVEDNGVGFDVKETTRKADSMGMNIGIRNISERLRYLCKGNLEIESEVGVGTKVTISIPFEEGTNGNE
ncbi:MAG: histidine kinase, partial [Butyrivibrio sp.]|nr:histidine kinase [Butyrivibrio sp.]